MIQIKFSIAIMLGLSLFVCSRRSGRPRHRVYKGSVDTEIQFPYAVSVQTQFQDMYFSKCTGSLLNELWVLTAGHCHGDETTDVIRHGDMSALNGTYVKISKTVIHPNYMQRTMHDSDKVRKDLALILMKKPIVINLYAQLSALDYQSLIGLPVTYAGFGSTYSGPFNVVEVLIDMQKPLQVGDGVVAPCEDKYELGWSPVICVKPRCSVRDQTPMPGDSGGPMTYDRKIVGVSSGGGIPGQCLLLMSPVSVSLHWIRDTMMTYVVPPTKFRYSRFG